MVWYGSMVWFDDQDRRLHHGLHDENKPLTVLQLQLQPQPQPQLAGQGVADGADGRPEPDAVRSHPAHRHEGLQSAGGGGNSLSHQSGPERRSAGRPAATCSVCTGVCSVACQSALLPSRHLQCAVRGARPQKSRPQKSRPPRVGRRKAEGGRREAEGRVVTTQGEGTRPERHEACGRIED